VRLLRGLLVAVPVLSFGVFGAQGIAGAQAGYPGTVVVSGGTITDTIQTVGDTFDFTFCGFEPGSAVTESINGTVVKTISADTTPPDATSLDGCISDSGTVSDPHLTLSGASPVAISYGNNSITASGVSPSGEAVNSTLIVPVSASSSSSSSGLAFTGADIMAMVIGGIALVALGFLILTFVRRRTTVSTS
jgi:hypothetical protein